MTYRNRIELIARAAIANGESTASDFNIIVAKAVAEIEARGETAIGSLSVRLYPYEAKALNCRIVREG